MTETSVTKETNDKLSDTERLKSILWHIEMLDARRSSISNRAAIVLSADALLLAATTLLLDKILSNITQYNQFERIVLALSIGGVAFFLALSIAYATAGIVNVWKTSREMLGTLGSDMPQRLFFHPTDTIKAFSGFSPFADKFNTTTKEQMTLFALGELWTVINQHYSRYQVLRKTIKLLILSIIPFLVAIAILLAKLF